MFANFGENKSDVWEKHENTEFNLKSEAKLRLMKERLVYSSIVSIETWIISIGL